MDHQGNPLPYKSVKGLEHIDKVIEIDQSPIGRYPPEVTRQLIVVFFTDIRDPVCIRARSQDQGLYCGPIFI